jgi:H+/Cl- antiporter ClcA
MTWSNRLRAISRLRLRALRAHFNRWQRRTIFAIGGLAVGLLAVALALCANKVRFAFQSIGVRWPYAPLIVTPLGFGAAVYLMRRYFPNAQGSGIPQAIATKEADDPDDRFGLVGPRVAISKFLLTLLGLLVGASTGRDGPTVQVGARDSSIAKAFITYSPSAS